MPKMRVKLTRRLFLLLRSARFLINDRDGAKEDFEESIAIMPCLVQSRVKLASVHMELSEFRFVLFFESDSARDETTTLTFSRLLFQTTSPTPSETSKPPSLRTLSIPISTTTEDRVRSLPLSSFPPFPPAFFPLHQTYATNCSLPFARFSLLHRRRTRQGHGRLRQVDRTRLELHLFPHPASRHSVPTREGPARDELVQEHFEAVS